MTPASRPISRAWIAVSIGVFMAIELLLGGGVAHLLAGRQVSHMLGLRIELLLSLASFLAGGFVVGLLSPGKRLLEPAIGAGVTVALTFLIALFTPLTFYAVLPGRMLLGGLGAFGIALFGAHLGERLTGN